MVRIDHVLDTWKKIREDSIAAVEEFPAAEFDFSPAPGVATFREIARHILDAGDGLTGLLLSGDPNLSGPDFRERLQPHKRPLPENFGPAELAAALRESIEQRTGQLAAQTPEFFSEIVTRVDGLKVTRLELVQFVKEHELTHRSQLFMCMRLKGLVPSTTRKRLARQAAR
ncbi:MAG TPA: DinB family protein [Bryobacteraceae bacterium]|jgi:uncharacterized damage-inducible protein DinB